MEKVSIYYEKINIVKDLDLKDNNSWMSEYRREKLERIKMPGDKKRSFLAEKLLFRAINELGEQAFGPGEMDYSTGETTFDRVPEISVNDCGKPYFADFPELFFSISHSGEYVAVAVSEGLEVGIDIQVDCKVSDRIAKRFFTENEQKALLAGKLEILDVFSRKEALAKLKGVSVFGRSNMLDTMTADEFFTDIELEGYHFVLCTGHKCEVEIKK